MSHGDPVPTGMDTFGGYPVRYTLAELRLMRDIAANFDLWDNVEEIDRRIAQYDGDVTP